MALSYKALAPSLHQSELLLAEQRVVDDVNFRVSGAGLCDAVARFISSTARFDVEQI